MKKITILSTAALTLSLALSGPAMAAKHSKEQAKTNELIGLGSGVLAGSLIAGPIGGVVAGIFGVMLADDVNDENKLKDSNALVSQKQQELLAMQQRLAAADARADLLMASMDKALEQATPQIESNIQFKTASAQLEAHYKNELDLLAVTLRKNPRLSVKLSGYADQRGDSAYNQNLSELRAEAVKNYLLEQGVSASQLVTESFGESELVSSGSHVEDNFFDRRVSLKVSDNAAMTAANQ